MKIFVSGLYRTGKTTLAKLIAEERKIKYIDFDDAWHYSGDFSNQSDNLFNGILSEDNYIIDAIPYDFDTKKPLDKFMKFCSENKDVFILFVFCSDFDKWLDRLKTQVQSREEYLKNHFDMNRNYMNGIKEHILLFYDSIESKYVHYSEFIKLTSWLD